MKSVEDIITEYIKSNGFDGLCNADGCRCAIKALMPCHGDIRYCEPYRSGEEDKE